MPYSQCSYPQGQWMPDDLPHLPTYAMAENYFNCVRPYSKGADVGERPLGAKRRYSRSLIHKHAGGEVVLTYYENPVVRLHPDGRKEFSICGYPSISTTCVLNETSKTDTLQFKREKGKIYAVYKGTFYRMPDHGYVEVSNDGAIRGYEIESQHSIDFDAMKAKREKYASFMTFIRDMLTINQFVEVNPNTDDLDGLFVSELNQITYMPSLKSLVLTERRVAGSMEAFFYLLDEALGLDEGEKLKRFYHLANKMLCCVLMEKHGRSAGMRVVHFEDAKHHFYELIKYRFASEVFVKKEVAPRDRGVHDSNKHYVSLVF